MKSDEARLTELEGAVLTEIAHRGNHTAFKVRRAFASSPSMSWSGSAGAVYPAIRRLAEAGLILAVPDDSKRGTRVLSLSPAGERAHERWFCDAETACSIGIDPFRLRSGLWEKLPATRRAKVIADMKDAVRAEMAKLTSRGTLDGVEDAGNRLAIQLQELRLAWLENLEGA